MAAMYLYTCSGNYGYLRKNVDQIVKKITLEMYLDLSTDGTLSRSNWDLEMLVFEERVKPEYPEKNLSEQGQEPTTNSTNTVI